MEQQTPDDRMELGRAVGTILEVQRQFEGRFDRSEARLDRLEMRLDRFEARLDRFEESLRETHRRFDDTKQQIDDTKQSIEALQHKVKGHTNRLMYTIVFFGVVIVGAVITSMFVG